VAVIQWKVALQAEYLRSRPLLIDFKVFKYNLAALLDNRPDTELERLVACASSFADGKLPPLVWQRAERILGSRTTTQWQGLGTMNRFNALVGAF
jgi:hypothetical protein